MADICSDTGCTTDIVKAQRRYKRVNFEEQRKRLADASTCAEHSDFCLPCGGCGKGTRLGGEKTGSRTGEHGGKERWQWQ